MTDLQPEAQRLAAVATIVEEAVAEYVSAAEAAAVEWRRSHPPGQTHRMQADPPPEYRLAASRAQAMVEAALTRGLRRGWGKE